jgi:hypothetical protein
MRTITGPIGFQSVIWRSPFDNIFISSASRKRLRAYFRKG